MAQSKSIRPEVRLVNVKRYVYGRIADARRALESAPLDDESVHKARKDLKRARAGLRLLREAIGKPAYKRANAALRDAARPLASVRDAKVLVDTVKALIEREKKSKRRAKLQALRDTLDGERVSVSRELERSGLLPEIERSLESAARDVRHWQVGKASGPVLRAGVERLYRKGRKALKAARAKGSDECLHELRKQVKYLGYALAIFEPLKSRTIARVVKRAESIADDLGDDHDLAMLEAKLRLLPPELRNAGKKLKARIRKKRVKLQRKALGRAQRLYQRKPKAFLLRIPVS
jgi:CHAD domain-containing protein